MLVRKLGGLGNRAGRCRRRLVVDGLMVDTATSALGESDRARDD
jgi:hypothetical protein